MRVAVGVSRLATALSHRLSSSSSSRLQRQRRQHSTHAATTSGRDESDSAAPAVVGTSGAEGEWRGRNPPPLRTYYADWAEVILPDNHRFPMEKYKATRLALEADKSLAGKMELVPSPQAELRDLLAVHEEAYVERVLNCALTEKEARAIGFPMHPSSVVRSLASTGGTVAATHTVGGDAKKNLKSS